MTAGSAFSVAVVCEGDADQRIACDLATPHPKRECWVLAGFEPADAAEEEALTQVRRTLAFDPRTKAERLTAEGLTGSKNAKTVLARLVGNSRDREAACWQQADLHLLAERGAGSRLKHYLDELSDRLVPMVGGERKPP